jgi:hypothetical protein
VEHLKSRDLGFGVLGLMYEVSLASTVIAFFLRRMMTLMCLRLVQMMMRLLSSGRVYLHDKYIDGCNANISLTLISIADCEEMNGNFSDFNS